MKEFGVRDLVLAVIDDASPRGGKREAVRLRAMRRAFGLDMDEQKRPEPLAGLFESTIRSYLEVGSPFDGYLEAPPEIIRMYRHHGDRIRKPLGDLRSALLDLLTDLAIARWALPPSMRVTEEELLHHGFNPADHPVTDDDYW